MWFTPLSKALLVVKIFKFGPHASYCYQNSYFVHLSFKKLTEFLSPWQGERRWSREYWRAPTQERVSHRELPTPTTTSTGWVSPANHLRKSVGVGCRGTPPLEAKDVFSSYRPTSIHFFFFILNLLNLDNIFAENLHIHIINKPSLVYNNSSIFWQRRLGQSIKD